MKLLIVSSSMAELQGVKEIAPTCEQKDAQTIVGRSPTGDSFIAISVGVGLVLSSIRTTEAILYWKPDYVVGIGICGAINEKFRVGDLLQGSLVIQYEMDLRLFNLNRGETFSADTSVWGSLSTLPIESQSHLSVYTDIVFGSANRFLLSSEREKQRWIRDELHIDAVDMESYAIASCAHHFAIPVSIIRSVSDTYRGIRPKSFPTFLSTASKQLCDIVLQMNFS